ncbi:glycosyltransferase [Flavobacteriaceae bacterium F08102]|nr:glycosyltransferase [Flavobacteriaceae bacterium F08102]
MKILHLITAFGYGGAEILLKDVANRQCLNHEVFIVSLKKENPLKAELRHEIEFFHLPMTPLILGSLLNLIREIRPDIIHTHLGHADGIGTIAARLSKVQQFATLHNVSIKKNWLDTIFFWLYRRLFLNIGKNVQVIGISESVFKHAEKTLKIPLNQLHLLYNAIPLNKSLCKSTTNFTKKDKIGLLFVGRLVKQKSVDTLLKAVKILKELGYENCIHLLVVGDGSQKEALVSTAVALNIMKMVSFEGETTDVQAYYAQADIFVLPSRWEGFGMVILEAFLAKLPVVASNLEGPSELINNGINGFLFEPLNENHLAKKLQFLIEHKKERIRMGQRGYNSIIEKYDINTYVDELNELYKKSLHE